jgi:heptosyltransferase I
MGRTAVLRLSALGDVTLVVPLIHELIKKDQGSEVVWVTTSPTRELLGPIKGCRYLIVEKVKGWGSLWRNWKLLRDETFDQLIVAQASFSAHFISFMIKARKKIGFDRRRGRDLHALFIDESITYKNEHFVEAYFQLGCLSGLPMANEPNWSIAFNHLDREWAKSYRIEGSHLVALHPHASKLERRWTQSGYKGIIGKLLNHGCTVLILGGSDRVEFSLNEDLVSPSHNSLINLTGKLSLPQWASFLSEVDLLVAPDTGAVHIANALSTRVVGLYAVANPELTGPYKAMDDCVNLYPMGVEKYALKNANDFHHRLHKCNAMEQIEPEIVWEKISTILELAQ